MPTLGMQKAVERIRLSDDPDSPEFIFDLSDSEMNKKAVNVAGCYVNYEKTMEDIEAGNEPEKQKIRLGYIYKQMIIALLGEDAYKATYDYLRNGFNVPEEELTLAMAPLVGYLMAKFDNVLTVNHNKAVLKYLDREDEDGADAL